MDQLGATNDKPTVENLVQQQIQDQVDKIDTRESLIDNLDALEYGANIDNKAFLQADDEEMTAEVEVPKPQPMPEVVVKAPEEAVSDSVIAESQAALNEVHTKTPGSKEKTSEKPLMPSADASKDSMDATFSYKPKPRPDIFKKKKPLNPEQ